MRCSKKNLKPHLFDDGTYLKDYYPDVNDTYYFSSFADRQIALSYSN